MRNLQRAIIINKLKQYVAQNIKDRSDNILRVWSEHCEYIVAQRFRRGQQMIALYTRIWDEHALRTLIQRFQKLLQKNAKTMLMSTAAFGLFDWNKERITLDSIKEYNDELDNIRKLKCTTLNCTQCGKRILFDMKVENIEYCCCPSKCSLYEYGQGDWQPYIERENMLIWRREEKSGLYAYKLYVTYSDITAEDFLHVQTDATYRKEWDNTAIALDIIDTDPLNSGDSHIIYWEMLWPKLFSNRDYVYSRRHFVNKEANIITIVNKSVKHPSCPIKSNNHRVDEYWSYMVIKPATTFDAPGLEFVLTYFDNPGVSIPSTLTSWVAHAQMPDFLNKLYFATKKYAEQKRIDEDNAKRLEKYSDPDFNDLFFLQNCSNINKPKELSSTDTNNSATHNESSVGSEQEPLETENLNAARRTSWWSYLHPYSYFA